MRETFCAPETIAMPIACEDIMQKAPLKVIRAEDLECLVDLIHDEYFDLDDVSFSEGDGTVTIPYRRVFHGHPGRLIRKWLLWRTHEVDVIRSVLTIRNVQHYEPDDRSCIGTYSFNTVSYESGTLLIACDPNLDLRVVVPKIIIESRDLEIRGRARITHGLFWEANTSKAYE